MGAASPALQRKPSTGESVRGASAPPAYARPWWAQAPTLCVATAFAGGIIWSRLLWNPASWWIAADIALLAAAFFFLVRTRLHLALALAVAALGILGALNRQLQGSGALAIANDNGFAHLTDGRESEIIGHVIREGVLRRDAAGRIRQAVDIETEQVSAESASYAVAFGIRLNIYSSVASENGEETDTPNRAASRQLNYGQRVRLVSELRQPRNFLDPGAFDYREFLSGQNIVALGSARNDKLEILSGSAGSRFGRWRSTTR